VGGEKRGRKNCVSWSWGGGRAIGDQWYIKHLKLVCYEGGGGGEGEWCFF